MALQPLAMQPLTHRYPQGSCNIDINFPELFVDGAGVASGMQINNVMGVTIGPGRFSSSSQQLQLLSNRKFNSDLWFFAFAAGGYFLNFTEYGVQINDGHEARYRVTWLHSFDQRGRSAVVEIADSTTHKLLEGYDGSLLAGRDQL